MTQLSHPPSLCPCVFWKLPWPGAKRAHLSPFRLRSSINRDFCPGATRGCRQPSALCKTMKPLIWRLGVYRNTCFLHGTHKSQRVFTPCASSHCIQRLHTIFPTCQELSAQLMCTITLKHHFTFWRLPQPGATHLCRKQHYYDYNSHRVPRFQNWGCTHYARNKGQVSAASIRVGSLCK